METTVETRAGTESLLTYLLPPVQSLDMPTPFIPPSWSSTNPFDLIIWPSLMPHWQTGGFVQLFCLPIRLPLHLF